MGLILAIFFIGYDGHVLIKVIGEIWELWYNPAKANTCNSDDLKHKLRVSTPEISIVGLQ